MILKFYKGQLLDVKKFASKAWLKDIKTLVNLVFSSYVEENLDYLANKVTTVILRRERAPLWHRGFFHLWKRYRYDEFYRRDDEILKLLTELIQLLSIYYPKQTSTVPEDVKETLRKFGLESPGPNLRNGMFLRAYVSGFIDFYCREIDQGFVNLKVCKYDCKDRALHALPVFCCNLRLGVRLPFYHRLSADPRDDDRGGGIFTPSAAWIKETLSDRIKYRYRYFIALTDYCPTSSEELDDVCEYMRLRDMAKRGEL